MPNQENNGRACIRADYRSKDTYSDWSRLSKSSSIAIIKVRF
ncbi:MAG: hypothetical protein QXQ24_08120 [Nitrososphaeria archaeon]